MQLANQQAKQRRPVSIGLAWYAQAGWPGPANIIRVPFLPQVATIRLGMGMSRMTEGAALSQISHERKGRLDATEKRGQKPCTTSCHTPSIH
jgi:hypothetical protein